MLLLERGDWVPQEPDNWSVGAVFFDKKYTAHDSWTDKTGKAFRPNMYYNVGGATKFFGGSMIRLRAEDFDGLEHYEGKSERWPVRYADIEPYYQQAEEIFTVHGDDEGDQSAPPRSKPYPYAGMDHEPIVQKLSDDLRKIGVSNSAMPIALDYRARGKCIRCRTCDGFPCKLEAKGDAETRLVSPALATGNVELLTNCLVRRLILSPDGKTITGVEVDRAGEIAILSAKVVVLSAGAVNSTALLLRSATDAAPRGVANSSDVVGRYYMAHNQTALMGLSFRPNDTVFQKTLSINHFYLGEPGFNYPMGHIQMLGKLQGGMLSANVPFLPKIVGQTMAKHSIDLIAFSEDLPDRDNRVTIKDGMINLSVNRNNLTVHDRLVKRMAGALRRVGYPLVLIKPLIKHSTSHQCGTARFGDDPATAALDPFCRSYDHKNLFVVDASFMPSSAAVNPSLTIAAQALRAADHMLRHDFGITASAQLS
ncbi:GMC family oxidoreductase [Devosia sp.]|uniref:GMC family oxidoreductase n=1 Tax=Devosia sp. TaxID=1871048 RepID=UPI0034506823